MYNPYKIIYEQWEQMEEGIAKIKLAKKIIALINREKEIENKYNLLTK